jgi:flavin reductase (DIM6/NTAB) family NADH-FMN oxidoreductase RutF
MDSAEFRRILGHWASSVGVVTTRTADQRPCGLTANTVTSLSLEPFLVLICVEKAADSHDCIRTTRAFAINILKSEQERVARRFATWNVHEKFEGLAYHDEKTGSPVLDDALAWIDCRVHAEYDGGDHTIFVGEVLAGDAVEGTPLVYYRGGYGRFTP